MNELDMYRVECNASDQPFGRLRRVIFPVTDDRMADSRELRPDLILQSGHQTDSDQSRAGKKSLDGIAEFGASRFGVSLRAQLLKHSYAPKIVDQSRLLGGETPAKDRQVLPHRRMVEKLANEYLSIRLCLGKKKNARRETIDAMDNQSSLSLLRESRAEQRQSGGAAGAFNRHGRQAGRLIDDYHGIVLVKHDQLPREAGRLPAALS